MSKEFKLLIKMMDSRIEYLRERSNLKWKLWEEGGRVGTPNDALRKYMEEQRKK